MIILISWWLAVVWTFSELVSRPFDDWKNGLLYVGAGLFVIASAVRQSRVHQRDRHGLGPRDDTFFVALILFYFSIAILSILFSPTGRYEGLLELARLILWLGLAWVFAQTPTRKWLWIFRVTVISAAMMAILTWFQSRGATIWPYGGPFLAPIGHISYYGDFMALSLVMAVGLWGQRVILRASPEGSHLRSFAALRMTPQGILWLLCMLLIDLGLALSATRASLMGVIVASIVSIPLVAMATRSMKTVGVVVLICLLNLAVIFSLPVHSSRGESASTRFLHTTDLSEAGIDTTSSGRWHTYITSSHITMERPLVGWGLGTFRFVYPEFAHRTAADSLVSSATWYMHPHNEILHQVVELGLPGVLLSILGFLYLLYRGIEVLRHAGLDPASQLGSLWTPDQVRGDGSGKILLITAMCGLTAAVVSWQFSTNFLFPVSRLMTALFLGMILQLCHRERSAAIQSVHTGLLRGLRPLAMTTLTLSTLLLLANQISLYCVQKEQTSRSAHAQWDYATWAVRLAPGAFDPLYIRGAVALNTLRPIDADPYVTSLYESYPYVPAVLEKMGTLRAKEGRFSDARELLQHALANDPSNTIAKQLLDQLPPAH